MKIISLEVIDYHPIKHLKFDNLGSTVIIAGANGSGKTRLKQAIVSTLQGSPVMDLTLGATRKDEEDPKYFAGKTITVKRGVQNPVLNNYINSRKYASGGFVGSLVQIDSSRSVQSLKYTPVNWLGGDPDDQGTSSNFYFSPFADRWTTFMNYIHQKSAARDKKLADELKKNPKNGEQIIKEHPDPLEKYKEIFTSLLPGKILQDIDPAKPREFQFKESTGEVLPFSSLSSGEQEVVKVLFDVVRKEIKHSVVIVDEPELHLHPTLTFKLIETLKTIGDHTNQFIFLTHSADLISTYYSTGDVYFIDAIQTGANQAHRLSELSHSHSQIVQLIGQNLGLFAVGKKLIFVEGENSSIDRLTYHMIAQKVTPEAKIIPVGSVTNIITLNTIEEQIRNTIFGINIFMIRDRDGLDSKQITELEKGGRIKCLKKRHIENYFLDHEVLFKVSEILYLTSTNPSLTSAYIESEIKKIAISSINFNLLKNTKEYLALNHFFKIPNVKSIDTKTIEVIKDEIAAGVKSSLGLLSTGLNEITFKAWVDSEQTRLEKLLTTDEWKNEFQGKIIFSKLCSDILKEDPLRVRQAYVDIALKEKPEVFDDITTIYKSF
jgi:ABC-type cobalamin/Fe3+-siderophores transport system ATPase subunit